MLTISRSLLDQLGRNLLLTEGHSTVISIPVNRLHAQQIYLTLKLFFRPNRQLNRHRSVTQPPLDLLNHTQEVGTLAIHLVHVNNTRNTVFVGLTPHGFRLRLDTRGTTENDDSTIKHAQRALYFDSEVNVTGGINNIDTMLVVLLFGALPEGSSSSGGNRNPPLLLLGHPVHGGSAIMDFAHLVVHTGIKQNPFRGRGLARIDVRTDTNIPVQINRSCTSHNNLLSRLETVVRERLVGFSHAVHVFTLLNSGTLAFGSINQLTSQAQSH